MMGAKEGPLQHHPNDSKEDKYSGNLHYNPEGYKAGADGDQKLLVPWGI